MAEQLNASSSEDIDFARQQTFDNQKATMVFVWLNRG